jgi:putative endonuclease
MKRDQPHSYPPRALAFGGGSRSVALGRLAEAAARTILRGAGYEVVESNYRCRGGEIDLVCRQGSAWVFVEVRARSATSLGTAAETVTGLKRHRILKAARAYMARKRLGEVDWRVALVTLALDCRGRVASFEILPSVIEDVPGL